MKRIVCFGPGPKFKGGIANYNTSLAKALERTGEAEVTIVSWTNQYPAIIPRDFVDHKSKADQLDGTNIKVHYLTNYNNPITWYKTFRFIRDLKPDMVIFQWSIAIQGLPLGCIARRLSRVTGIEVIFDLHFVIQKEGSNLDKRFTRMGIKNAHTYIVHSIKTARELAVLFPNKTFALVDNKAMEVTRGNKKVIRLYHPVYDMFKPDPSFDVEGQKAAMNLRKHVFLFFGFIRKYKGLHNVIPAFELLARERNDVSLLIAGESFWETLDSKKFTTRLKRIIFGALKSIFLNKESDERNYRPLELIEKLNLQDRVYLMNDFIPNEDVHKYFMVSDAILLFYETATPSGVESIAYNYHMPILATSVGHFPDTVKDGYNGYLAAPNDIQSMASAMRKAIEKPILRDNVAETSSKMSWDNYAHAIIGGSSV
jgi:glycosyltransferase involved in cell wall biosynthesis